MLSGWGRLAPPRLSRRTVANAGRMARHPLVPPSCCLLYVWVLALRGVTFPRLDRLIPYVTGTLRVEQQVVTLVPELSCGEVLWIALHSRDEVPKILDTENLVNYELDWK